MKKLFLLSFIALITVVGLIFLSTFISNLGTGRLNVTTNLSSATVSLLIGGKSQVLGTGSASTHLKPGNYLVTATTPTSSTRAVVTINAGKVTDITLALRDTQNTAQVANFAAKDISVLGPDLTFLNTNLRQAYQFNTSTNKGLSLGGNLYNVTRLFWIGHQNGYAVSNTGDPFLITGGSSSLFDVTNLPVAVPFTKDFHANAVGDYTYIQDRTIFRSIHGQGPAKPLIQSSQPDQKVRIGPDGTLLVIEFPLVEFPSTGQGVLVYASGQTETLTESAYISGAEWSTDSSLLALNTVKEFKIFDTNTKSYKLVLDHPLAQASSFNWVDATHLIYTDGAIWMYNSITGVSDKLADNPGWIDHEAPFTVADGGLIYFGTDATDNLNSNVSIYKLSLPR